MECAVCILCHATSTRTHARACTHMNTVCVRTYVQSIYIISHLTHITLLHVQHVHQNLVMWPSCDPYTLVHCRSSPTQQARRALPAAFHKVKNMTKRYLHLYIYASTWSHGGHMMVTWWSHDGHMMVTWWSHDSHMMVTWWSHDGHMVVT